MRASLRNLISWSAIAVLIISSIAPVSAAVVQTVSTTLRGTVKDPSEAVVSGAKVTLIDNATKRQVTSTTDEEGAYLFTDVSAGNYTIIAEHPSFKKGEV